MSPLKTFSSKMVKPRITTLAQLQFLAILIFFCGYSSAYSGSCWKSDPPRSICPSGQYRPSYNENGCLPCLALLILLPISCLWFCGGDDEEARSAGVGVFIIFLITFFPCFYCSPCCSYVEPGYYFENNIDESRSCTARFENGNLVWCGDIIYKKACSAGTYNKEYGQSACSACAAGYFSDGEGWTTCHGCPAGRVSTSSGRRTCTACPAGKYAGTCFPRY